MACDTLCPQMQMRAPPPILRSLFSTHCPIPKTCLILCPNNHQLVSCACFASHRFGSSSSAARIPIDAYNPSVESLYSYPKPPKFYYRNGDKQASKKASACDMRLLVEKDLKFGLTRSLDESGNGGIMNLNEKKGVKWYSEMLGKCAKSLWLKEGEAIHCEMIKNGIDPDAHLWVSLINFYAKCGALDFACRVLDLMPERDVVSWTALISGFVAEGHGGEGVELFCKMREEGVRPNLFTLATGLKGCSMCLDLAFGKQLHAEVVKVGGFIDVYVGSALVDLYAKCGEMEYASKVFFFMPEHNAVSWNALLNGYAEAGNGEEVLRLFCRMTDSDMRFSNYTLSTVLKGCASSGSLKIGQVVHSMAIKIGGELDDFISSSLVDMYSKCGLADEALKVFKRIKDPDVVAWSTMISGLDQQWKKREAAELFYLMRLSGLKPNQFTLASVVSAATDLDDLFYSKSIHACILKFGFESESLVGNALIAMYMKLGSPEDGHKFFEAMNYKDVVSWNARLVGYHDDETSNQGLNIFKEMLTEGFKPNLYTFVNIVRCCSSISDVKFGKQVHAHIVKADLQSDTYVGTVLIDMYAKFRCLEGVEVIFNHLNNKDLFAWTVMIGGYVQSDQGEKAVQYFRQMQREGIKPNEYTIASCLRGCSAISSLENGRQLHSLALKAGHFGDRFVASALVDMYSKCGCLDDAVTIFNGVVSCDTVLWNTIICGFSQHGQGAKAITAFKTMIDEGALPDGVTFLGVLSACSHMGLIEEGRKHFQSMKKVYGVTPTIEHCACMVNLLGRAGKFDEVESFIKDMKLAPSGLIWETVLGACRIHNNVQLGERAAKTLFEIEPEVDANYILLSNIYASKGMWDDVSKIRALMSHKGIKKEPGCSWVEIDAQIHVFLSQDASHPRAQDIYQKLEDLEAKLTSVGYIPKTENVLHNVAEKEKRKILSYHSERLALALSLISDIPNGKVRIFKNLRICEDCHEFMKHVSGIIDREIVVRDVKHFHHFRGGMCSCKDYW